MSAATPVAWEHRRERGSVWLARFMVRLSLTMGRPLGRVVLCGIAVYFLLFAPAARRASRAFLARALGRPARWIERYRHVFWFASTIHDRVFLLRHRTRQFAIEVRGAERLHQALHGGQGGFLIGAHVGSFEVLRCAGVERGGLRVAMAMYEDNAHKVNDTLRAINPEATLDTIALGRAQSMLALRDKLDAGYLVGMLADRSLDARGDVLQLPFLGAPAAFPVGPWRLAAVLRRPVFFMVGLYLGGNRYQLRFEPLADFSDLPLPRERRRAAVEAAMRRYVATLEQVARESPWNWFNFYDFWQEQ